MAEGEMTPEEAMNLVNDFIRTVETSDPKFAQAYKLLSLKGQCDAFGGSESRRVYHEWAEAGKPSDVANFIRKRANC